jgi:glycosyltransferase involved in cell wall biosynthesis
LVGDGPELPRALAQAQQLGIRGQISTVGVVDDVAPFLGAADVLVLPSEAESFGLVALEAMASGVPVVASRTGGLPEVVPDGRAGYLLPPADTAGMADKVVSILADGELRRAMGAAGHAHALRHFSSTSVVPRFEQLYRRVLASRGAPNWPPPGDAPSAADAESSARTLILGG